MSNYKLESAAVSQDLMFKKYGKVLGGTDPKDLLTLFEFLISLEEKHIYIEYVKISEVLAMFVGIFNTLLALGVIAKIIS